MSVIERPTLLRVSLIWLVTQCIVFGAALAGSWTAVASSPGLGTFAAQWLRWDARWFASIAEVGYLVPDFSAKPAEPLDFSWNGAFFPAVPMLMRLGGAVGLSPEVTGLLDSLAASLVAAIALAQLGRDFGASPTMTVTAWLVAPVALFVAAPYTEALFCAFAFWAWVQARRGHWIAAGVLAAGAALCRSNGLFLGIGLVVVFLVSARRTWSRAWALLLPFLATFAYLAYLGAHTGRWTAWFDIQRLAWSRELTAPWVSLQNTVSLMFTFTPDGSLSTRFLSELLAMGLLVAFTGIVLWKRWWGEGVYMGITTIALGTSAWYYSLPRTLVVLFPIWVVIGLWMTRHRWFRIVYVVGCVPLLVLVTARFVQDQWIS